MEIAEAAPDRLTFADNYCEHYSTQPDDSRATVPLVAVSYGRQGSHVKAEPKFFPFHFHNIPGVIFMGNISTGGFLQLPGPTPAPPAAFNNPFV